MDDFSIDDPATLESNLEEIDIGCGGGGLTVCSFTKPIKQILKLSPVSKGRHLLDAWLELQERKHKTFYANAVITILASGASYQCNKGRLSQSAELEYEFSWWSITGPDQA